MDTFEVMDQDWEDRPGIFIDDLLPGWATYRHPDMPRYLRVRVKISRTTDMGLAPEAVLVERRDGHAVTARDLRSVRLPQSWMLADNGMYTHPWEPYPENPLTATGQGPRGKGDDHWRAVLRLWTRAQRDAPRAPVRWMRERWPAEVSDATMRRWVKRAQERAGTKGWKEDHDEQALPGVQLPRAGHHRPGRQAQAGQAAGQQVPGPGKKGSRRLVRAV